MSQLYGRVTNERGESTRTGSKKGYLRASAAGWNAGANVYAEYEDSTDTDEIAVSLTGGSHDNRSHIDILTFNEKTTIEEIACKLEAAAHYLRAAHTHGWPV